MKKYFIIVVLLCTVQAIHPSEEKKQSPISFVKFDSDDTLLERIEKNDRRSPEGKDSLSKPVTSLQDLQISPDTLQKLTQASKQAIQSIQSQK